MTSYDRYAAWAKENVDTTLWVHKGPRNTDVAELRMVVMGGNEHSAIITIYKGDNGFAVYKYAL